MNDPLADYKWREGQMIENRVKYWETIADNLSKAGWNCSCLSSTDHDGGQFWVAAAEHEDAGHFIVRMKS